MGGRIGVTMTYGTILPGAKLLQRVGRSISSKAKLRLGWIDWYFAHGTNKRLTSRHFGISPTTLYKWLVRYSYRNCSSLEERSRAPVHTRQSAIARKTIDLVIELRKKDMGLSKYKLSCPYIRTGSAPPKET